MALARFPVLDVCAGVWTCPHAVVGNRDELVSVCGCSAPSSTWYHGKWRESQLLLGPSAGLLLSSVSVASLIGKNSFSRRIVRPRSPPSPISIGRAFPDSISSALSRVSLASVVSLNERARGDSHSHSAVQVQRLEAVELCGACHSCKESASKRLNIERAKPRGVGNAVHPSMRACGNMAGGINGR